MKWRLLAQNSIGDIPLLEAHGRDGIIIFTKEHEILYAQYHEEIRDILCRWRVVEKDQTLFTCYSFDELCEIATHWKAIDRSAPPGSRLACEVSERSL